jgi:hypothetical protein
MEEVEPFRVISERRPDTFALEINKASREGYEIVGAPYSHSERMHVLMKYVNPEAMAEMMSKVMSGMPGGMM